MASSNPIPTLAYRWEYQESADHTNPDWTPLSYEQCQTIERDLIIQAMKKTTLDSKTEAYIFGDGYKLVKDKVNVRVLRRTDTFTGKVLGINKIYKRGFVESNFPNNQSKGIRFFFTDCQFNAMSLMKGNTIKYKIKYDENKSEFAAYNVTFKQHIQKQQERIASNKQDKKQFAQRSYVQNMAQEYGRGKKRNYKPFRPHKMSDVSKPLWHPQYMSIVLNGYFTKYHDNAGIIRRQKGSKSAEKESDEITFYFNHCTPTFLKSYQQRQRPIFVKFKIGYVPGQRDKLLAYDIDFDYEKPKRIIKSRGEIKQLTNRNNIHNKSGWIYSEEDNWYYPFDNVQNVHYNIGNTVYFNTFMQNGMNRANNIDISKKYDEAIWKLIYNQQTKVIHNNILGDKGKPLYIRNAPIDLTEDLLTEFKQFKALNGYCNVIKIGEVMLKYLNAFVNTQGGSIYFGIDDNGIVRGQQFVDDEAQDNIQKYIDNRLRQWTPKSDYLSLKMGVKLDFIQVIRRRDDGNCYLLPDVIVIRAFVNGIKPQNGKRFKNQDNKSWTKNLASLARVISERNLFGGLQRENDMDDYKNNDIKAPEPGTQIGLTGGLQLDISVDIESDVVKLQKRLKEVTGSDAEEGIISDVYKSQDGNYEKTLRYLCLLFASEQN